MLDLPASPRFRPIGANQLLDLPQTRALTPEARDAIRAVAAVLPFRINRYVADALIDWEAGPTDPIFNATIPQPGMLHRSDFRALLDLVRRDASRAELEAAARPIRARMNPHPAGQVQANVPEFRGERLTGVQHKYRQTALFFPAAGQTCHTYCTYCFRWAQFVDSGALRFAERDGERVADYLRAHPAVTDVLITGGDPMVMSTRRLRASIEPLLAVPSVRSIRIGTRSLSWWPQRFTSDADADDLLVLFEQIAESGRQLAVMAHWTHPRELEPEPALRAIARIRSAGATIRGQAPILRGVNDRPQVWAELWQRQVELGAVPYYLFVPRDTGPRDWFGVTLDRALQVYRQAWTSVSGLARTVRGPSMSASPGKIGIRDVVGIGGERAFVCQFLQARDPAWDGRTFLARYDRQATWLDDLEPLEGDRFEWEDTPRLTG